MTEFFTGLGDFFMATFRIITTLGNSANYLFMAIIASLLIYWLLQLMRFKRMGQE